MHQEIDPLPTITNPVTRMNKLYYSDPTQPTARDGPQTGLGDSRTDVALDHASQQIPASASTLSPIDDSARGREKGPAAGIILTRLLAVLVVVMVVTSILGLTLFDPQGGNTATALVSLAIGGSAAVLGLTFGFREAHRSELAS